MPLIRGRVLHGECEAIDQLAVNILPEPHLVDLLLDFRADFDGQFMQRPFRQFGPTAAIVSRVGGRHGAARLLLVSNDASHGRSAGGLLAVAENLAQERPDHDGGRVTAPPKML